MTRRYGRSVLPAAGEHIWMVPAIAAAVALACACSGGSGGGDDDADAGDADVGDGSDAPDLPVSVQAPTSPDPVDLGPCPGGWREVPDPDGGVATCDPWPVTGPETCARGEAHFPGEEGCRTVGAPCPAGSWPDDLPDDGTVLFVSASVPDGGDGTRTNPFSTITYAFDAAGPGDTVALSKGTFRECLFSIPEGVTLRGACTAQTLVTCDRPIDLGGTVVVFELDTAIRDLTVSGSRPGIWIDGPAASCDIEGVIVEDTVGSGVTITENSEVTARDLVVRRISPDIGDGTFGRGLDIYGQSQVVLERALVREARNRGIVVAESGTDVTLRDVAVMDTLPNPRTDALGEGIHVHYGTRLEAERLVVEDSLDRGIYAQGAEVILSDCVVRGTRSARASGEFGYGLVVDEASTLSVTRGLFEDNQTVSVVVGSSVATLEDLVIRDTLAQALDGLWGRGLNIQTDADVEAHRLLIDGNREVGLAVGAGSHALMTDLTVKNTWPREADDIYGNGIGINEDGDFEGERILVEDCNNIGIGILASTAVLTDVEVTGIRHHMEFPWQAVGIAAAEGSDVTLTRVWVHDNESNGLALDGSTVGIEDLHVADTYGQVDTGAFGRGLVIQGGAQVQVLGAVFERNRQISVCAFDPESHLTLSNVLVMDSLRQDCEATWCTGESAGVGVGAYSGSLVTLDGFWVWRSALAGIQIAHAYDEWGTPHPIAGSIVAADGEVAWNTIGANIQDPEFDVETLQQDVVWYENDRNLDMTLLPVPGMGDLSGLSD